MKNTENKNIRTEELNEQKLDQVSGGDIGTGFSPGFVSPSLIHKLVHLVI